MKKEEWKSLLRLLTSVLVIVAVMGVAYLVAYLLGWTEMTEEELQEKIAATGALAPLVYILVSFVQVTFIPIPAAITIVAGSYLFGPWEAFLYSYIGMMLGAMLAFGLGKWIGRPFVDWATGGKEKTDAWIEKLRGREKVLLFFMFFFPGFPDDILCTVAGLLTISWMEFFLMQLVTRVTSIGATLLFMSGQVIPFHGWGLWVLGAVAVVCVLAFILCMRYADKINARFLRLADGVQGALRKKRNFTPQGGGRDATNGKIVENEETDMKKIASFQVNHDTLEKGMYISRIDGDVVTYDVRMKKPNGGDYFSMSAAHTLEHLFATYARNSKWADGVIYVGPMGCRTGFYLLLRDSVSREDAIRLAQECMAFARDFEGEIPGSRREECGNYLDHDLAGAKALAADTFRALEGWTVEKLQYLP